MRIRQTPGLRRWIVVASFLIAANTFGASVAGAQSYSDNFEAATINPFWVPFQQNGTLALSTDQSHSGLQSVKLSATTSGQKNVSLAHTFPQPIKGTLSVWFYDTTPGSATQYSGIYAFNSVTPTNEFGINVADWNGTNYIWHGPGVGETATSIIRTPGWHEFKLQVGATNFDALIDGVVVGSIPGDYKFDSVYLLLSGPSGSTPSFYFDDFRFIDPATTHLVDDDMVQCPTAAFTSIQAAVTFAVPGDTIQVCAGTYPENLILNKSLMLLGAQAGVDARLPRGSESTVTALTGTLLTVVTGSAGSIIDGFTFSGGVRAIESATGPINDLQILNNRIQGFTGNGVFLNDSGINITVNQNEIDGAAKVGSGALFHLDTDNFDGLHFTNNRVVNGATATGFFVDGNRNVDALTSGARIPLFRGNFIANNNTGVNLGSRAWGDGPITGNVFARNNFDGLQGGPRDSTISLNSFDANGRNGLALTSFGNVAADRGAQRNTITQNCFSGNGFSQAGAGISFSASQAINTISTNVAHDNNIFLNAVGARYLGTETINAEDNYWGSPRARSIPPTRLAPGTPSTGTPSTSIPS